MIVSISLSSKFFCFVLKLCDSHRYLFLRDDEGSDVDEEEEEEEEPADDQKGDKSPVLDEVSDLLTSMTKSLKI